MRFFCKIIASLTVGIMTAFVGSDASAIAFTLTQNNNGIQFLNNLLGNTTGLSNFRVSLTGDARAFGTFQNDPFGLQSGVALSTGKVIDLVGTNISDGGFSPGTSIPLAFTKLDGLPVSPSFPLTAVYRADLSGLGFDINSLTIADSGSTTGGAPGRFSGFDLDAIKLSNTLITSAADINALPGLDVFDFSPARTFLTPGTQRPPAEPELFGTTNGNINNAVATLENFDAFPLANSSASGDASLGDGGKVGFNLTSPVSTSNPLYLYIGEVGDNGELAAGQISVSSRLISGLNDLSNDFGFTGTQGDSISLQIEFDADDTASQLFFQYVFGSEEFVEFGGRFNDAFSMTLNGFNLARLSDGASVTINNLVPSPFGPYHPDFIYNPVGAGPASAQTKLDGYTKPLTFGGNLRKNAKNTLVITVRDTRDGLFDSAVFLKGGTLGTVEPPPIPEPGSSIPEPSTVLGLLVFGALGASSLRKQQRKKSRDKIFQ